MRMCVCVLCLIWTTIYSCGDVAGGCWVAGLRSRLLERFLEGWLGSERRDCDDREEREDRDFCERDPLLLLPWRDPLLLLLWRDPLLLLLWRDPLLFASLFGTAKPSALARSFLAFFFAFFFALRFAFLLSRDTPLASRSSLSSSSSFRNAFAASLSASLCPSAFLLISLNSCLPTQQRQSSHHTSSTHIVHPVHTHRPPTSTHTHPHPPTPTHVHTHPHTYQLSLCLGLRSSTVRR